MHPHERDAFVVLAIVLGLILLVTTLLGCREFPTQVEDETTEYVQRPDTVYVHCGEAQKECHDS